MAVGGKASDKDTWVLGTFVLLDIAELTSIHLGWSVQVVCKVVSQ